MAGGGGGQQETMNLKAPLITVLNQALSVEISIQTLHARAFPVHAFRGYHYPARACAELLLFLCRVLSEKAKQ